MNHEQFAALVARLEPIAIRNSSGYEKRVILLALFGYAYLGLVIMLLIALVAGSAAAIVSLKLVAVKVLVLVIPFLWLVLKALWVNFPPPEGVEITREYAPELFNVIEKLRRTLRCTRFHHVLITNEFNAAVQQNPRLGPFGWYRNYLLIGLPLMKAMTPAQLEAILAHEFGHLAGGHGAVANHIYRLRMSWARLLDALDREKSSGMVLFLPFFKWFSPYFSAYSFPLARANEYHADAVSAQLCGTQVAAQALTSVAIVSEYLGARFWPGIYKQAEWKPVPALTPFQAMSGQFSQAEFAESAQASIDLALLQITNVDNTHPAFADRLKALGESPALVLPSAGAAADTLLGNSLQRITDLHDDDWKRAVTPSWQQRYASIQKDRENFAAYVERENAGEVLPPDDALQYALLIDDIGADHEASLSRLRALQKRAPEHVPACYHLGLKLLAREDGAGVTLIERCMVLDEEAVLPGCEVLFHYCNRHQLEDQAAKYKQLYEEKSGRLKVIAEEQSNIKIKEHFEKHGLSQEILDGLRAQLQAIVGLRKVYFVRRRLKHQPDKEAFAMGFVTTPWWKWQNAVLVEEVQSRIIAEVVMPGTTLVFCVEGSNYQFGRKFLWMRGSRIL